MLAKISLFFSNNYRRIKLFLLQDRFFSIVFSAAIVLNLVIWVLLYFKIPHFGGFLPLHYNIYFGVDLTGMWYELIMIPVVGLFIILANFILATLVHSQEKILGYFLLSAALLAQLLLLVGFFWIVFINM